MANEEPVVVQPQDVADAIVQHLSEHMDELLTNKALYTLIFEILGPKAEPIKKEHVEALAARSVSKLLENKELRTHLLWVATEVLTKASERSP